MASKTEICNWAIGLVAEVRINDVSDQTEPARLCDLHYEQTVAEVLSRGKWRSARQRANLTRLTAAPDFGWAYQFQLPVNFGRIVEFNDLDTSITELDTYEIEGDRLLTDELTASILYIAKPDDPSRFSAPLVRCIYIMLAAKIAYPLTHNSSRQGELMEMFERDLPAALASDATNARSQVPDARASSRWFASRFSSSAG